MNRISPAVMFGLIFFISPLVLTAIVAPAVAQDCPSNPWPITRFEIIHRRSPMDIEFWLENLIKGTLYEDELGDAQVTADAGWDRLLEDYLHDIALRFEAAGFGCPDLYAIRVDDELRYPIYLVNLGDHLIHGWFGNTGVNMQHPIFPNHILIDQQSFSSDSGASEEDLYGALAHELFHSIQASYDSEYGSIRKYMNTVVGEPGGAFVVEGGAQGVKAYLVSQRFPGYRESEEDGPLALGSYAYDYKRFVEASMDESEAYKTGSFWLHVAERYGGLSTIEYFLRQPLQGLTTDDRIRWIERGLSEKLYSVFPHFLTELASYGWSRYDAVTPESWLLNTLYGCTERDSEDTGPPVTLTLEDTHEPWYLRKMPGLTGQCVGVKWNVDVDPDVMASVTLEVEIASPTEAPLEQLHVGLANATIYEGNCWEKMSGRIGPGRRRINCVVPGDGPPMGLDGEWTRTWTLEPADYGNNGDATFVIANVANTSWETAEVDDLEIRFRFLVAGALVSFSASAAGRDPLETQVSVMSDYTVESDKLRFGIIGYRDDINACMVQLDLPSETGDLVTLAGLLPMPLTTGEFPVVTAVSSRENQPGHMVARVWPKCEKLDCSRWNNFNVMRIPYVGTFKILRISRKTVVGNFDLTAVREPIRVSGSFLAPLGAGGLSSRDPCAPAVENAGPRQ
jgi:hypothetical protein